MATAQVKLTLEWTEAMSVGVDVFDNEHQGFFLLVRKLYDAMRVRASRRVVNALLGELYAYSLNHMSHEEEVLERLGYPELEAHRNEHKYFRSRLRAYMEELELGRTTLAMSLLQFTQEWLTNHIAGADREYAEFMRGKKVISDERQTSEVESRKS